MNKSVTLEFPKPEKVFNKQIFDNLTDYDSRIDLWYGGAASGKSHGGVQKVVVKALQSWRYPRRVLVLRKVSTTIKDSIFQDFLERLSDWELLDYCKVNNTDKRITLPNGAEFLFKGLDNPEKIKSIKGVSDIVMEEATEFNPVSKVNWVYKTFFEHDFEGAKIHLSTYLDNRFIDEKTRETIERLSETNAAYYKIYALGEFATLDKLIFPKYEKRLLNPHSPEMMKLPSYFGLDFGFTNDPSVFVHVKVDKLNKILYFMECYAKQGMLNDAIAHVIKSMGYGKELIVADAAEKKSIAKIVGNWFERNGNEVNYDNY